MIIIFHIHAITHVQWEWQYSVEAAYPCRACIVEMAVPYSQEKPALIKWLGENRFSILPLCHARDQTQCKCVSSADFKWINPKGNRPDKYYNALILMISGCTFVVSNLLQLFQSSLEWSFQITENRVKWKRLEQRIINEEITADEVAALAIEETEEKVDSTTPEKDTMSKIGTLPSKDFFRHERWLAIAYTIMYIIDSTNV